MKHARKLLLLHNISIWVKNDDNPLVNVTIGSFDGAEVCELVSLYLLSKVFVATDLNNFGLYSGDWLAVIHNANAQSKID